MYVYLEATQLDGVTAEFTCLTNGTVTAIVPRLVNFADAIWPDPVKQTNKIYDRLQNAFFKKTVSTGVEFYTLFRKNKIALRHCMRTCGRVR